MQELSIKFILNAHFMGLWYKSMATWWNIK